MKFLARIRERCRQRWCHHVCWLGGISARDADGLVSATCLKCGKVFRGDGGLTFPCTWTKDRSSVQV